MPLTPRSRWEAVSAAVAGVDKLQAACSKLAPIQTGEAVITPGFNLSAKYVIHAAGPIYRDGKHNEEALFCSCYANSLDLAQKTDAKVSRSRSFQAVFTAIPKTRLFLQRRALSVNGCLKTIWTYRLWYSTKRR